MDTISKNAVSSSEDVLKNMTYADYSKLVNQIYDDIGNKQVQPGILHSIYLQLERSKKYPPELIPSNIVTMNSKIKIRFLDTGESDEIKIVYPLKKAGDDEYPIYHPLAFACLGSNEGAIIKYNSDGYTREIKIEKILFQPEKQGMFNL